MKRVSWGKNIYHFYYDSKPEFKLSTEEIKIIQNTLKYRNRYRNNINSRILKRGMKISKK